MAEVVTMSLDMPLKPYLDYLAHVRCLSTHTIRSYRNDLEAWNYWLEEQEEEWQRADSICIRGFLANMSLRKMTASSINRRLSSLRGFYDWASEREENLINPFKKTRGLKKSKNLPTYLNSEEFDTLINLTGSDFLGVRDRLIMEVLYSTGCRVSELCSMDRHALDGTEIRVMGKGKKERLVFLGEPARKALEAYLALRDPMVKSANSTERALFLDHRGERLTTRGVYYIIEKYNLKSGLNKKIGPHTFRHSFATSLVNEGADIRLVQEMLGHASLSTTQVYSHTGIEKIRQVYRQSHPHGKIRR
jgi:integrase/recombinase XerC